MKNFVVLIVSVLITSGCVMTSIDGSIREYKRAAINVDLGDTKQEVLTKLNKAVIKLPTKNIRLPDKYTAKGKEYEIIYFRSDRQPDGLTTDDEYTPYIFRDRILVAVGWQALGGPKSVGKIRY